ncbi:MAG: DUF1573 domain-containing protein [Rikenellaceae bacterium]
MKYLRKSLSTYTSVFLFLCVGCGNISEQTSSITNDIVVEVPLVEGAKYDTIHIGKMIEGDIYNGSFEVYNKGSEAIVIADIKAECGCTKTKFDPQPILAGEKRTIELAFNSVRRPGKQKKAIKVRLSNGEEFKINFDAEVAPKGNTAKTH